MKGGVTSLVPGFGPGGINSSRINRAFEAGAPSLIAVSFEPLLGEQLTDISICCMSNLACSMSTLTRWIRSTPSALYVAMSNVLSRSPGKPS